MEEVQILTEKVDEEPKIEQPKSKIEK